MDRRNGRRLPGPAHRPRPRRENPGRFLPLVPLRDQSGRRQGVAPASPDADTERLRGPRCARTPADTSCRRRGAPPMTESEWLTSTAPEPMLAFLRNAEHVTERTLRLYACACCRG